MFRRSFPADRVELPPTDTRTRPYSMGDDDSPFVEVASRSNQTCRSSQNFSIVREQFLQNLAGRVEFRRRRLIGALCRRRLDG
jgi:hypothetical protein